MGLLSFTVVQMFRENDRPLRVRDKTNRMIDVMPLGWWRVLLAEGRSGAFYTCANEFCYTQTICV